MDTQNTTENTQNPDAQPAPQTPQQKPYHVEKSTIEERVINPLRPDFNAQAQSAYLPQSENLNGQQKANENEEIEKESQDQVSEGEGVEQKPGDEDTDQKDEQQTEVHQDKPNRQERISQYLAEMAKERAKIRQKEKELEERSKKVTGVDINELRNKAKEDPMSVLEEIGLSYNDLTKRIISGKDSQEKRELQKALEKLDSLEKQIKEREQKEEQAKINQQLSDYKNQMITHLKERGSEYELVNATENYDAVYQTIQAYFQQYNKVLTFDEAASVVENELEKQELARLEAIRKTNKAKKWGFFSPADQANEQSVNVSQPAQGGQPSAIERRPVSSGTQKTITGDMVATTPMKSKRRLTREESLAEAAKLLRFNQ